TYRGESGIRLRVRETDNIGRKRALLLGLHKPWPEATPRGHATITFLPGLEW
ncbi:hypothetical protein M569_11035, partial [Genlisea aurea]